MPPGDQVIAATSALVTAQQNTYAPTTGLIADFVEHKIPPVRSLPRPTSWRINGRQYHFITRCARALAPKAPMVFANAASKGAVAEIDCPGSKPRSAMIRPKVRAGYKLDGTAAVSPLGS